MRGYLKTEKGKKIVFGSFSMGLVAGIMCLVFIKQGIYPFGDKTLIYNDMQYQYLDFFMWFRNVLHGEDSFLYSFYMGMGGNSISLIAYYLASPLNLLAYFVKAEYMAEFLTLLIGLKLMLCSLTSYIYLVKRFKINTFYACIIAVSYALMGYNILQCSNIMWLDGVIILPFVALGISKYIQKRKTGLYFWSLFYAIFSNWYIGYMICLFAVLYFLFEYVYQNYVVAFHKKGVAEFLKSVFGFGIISVLSVGGTCFLFLPQTLHMMNDGEKFDLSIFAPQFGFSILDGFRDFFLEPDKLVWSEGVPPVYIGSFVFVTAVLLLVSKRINLKKKYLAAVFLCGLMFVFNYRPLNYIFTLFKIPSSHTYRYAFIFGFFMIVVSAMCLKEIGEICSADIKRTLFIIIGLLILMDYVSEYSIREMAYLSGLLAVLTGVGLIGSRRKSKNIIVLMHILILACTITEFYQKMDVEFEDHAFMASIAGDYNKKMQKSIAEVKKMDDSYYRMDKTFARTLGNGECNNEGMAFGYSSISNYSSTNNVKVAEMMKKCGYTGDTTVVSYMPILAMDSLMGVKYIYSEQEVVGGKLVQENIMESKNLYKNPYALSAGYSAVDLQGEIVWEDNPLYNQEMLYEKILGEKTNLYVPTEVLSVETDSSSYTQWNLQVKETGPLYVYFTNGQEGMTIYADGKYISGNTWYNNQVEFVGDYEKDDIVTITVTSGNGWHQEDYGICTGTLDMQQFGNSIEKIQQEPLSVKRIEKNKIVLEKNWQGEKNSVLTIPYEKGWEIKINGKEISYYKGFGTFIGLELPADKCIIEMEYKIPGKIAGICISVLCIFLYVILWNLDRKKYNGMLK